MFILLYANCVVMYCVSFDVAVGNKLYLMLSYLILLEKLTNSGLPRHIVRWIGAFLLDRRQKVMIGSNCSRSGSPNGEVPQGTLSGPKCFYCTLMI